jgi:hypothetical protein
MQIHMLQTLQMLRTLQKCRYKHCRCCGHCRNADINISDILQKCRYECCAYCRCCRYCRNIADIAIVWQILQRLQILPIYIFHVGAFGTPITIHHDAPIGSPWCEILLIRQLIYYFSSFLCVRCFVCNRHSYSLVTPAVSSHVPARWQFKR